MGEARVLRGHGWMDGGVAASLVLRVRKMGLFWAGLCVRYDAEANCWLVGPLLVRRADGGYVTDK